MDIAMFMLFIATCACIRVWPDGVLFRDQTVSQTDARNHRKGEFASRAALL
jgi:hypothetical protein